MIVNNFFVFSDRRSFSDPTTTLDASLARHLRTRPKLRRQKQRQNKRRNIERIRSVSSVDTGSDRLGSSSEKASRHRQRQTQVRRIRLRLGRRRHLPSALERLLRQTSAELELRPLDFGRNFRLHSPLRFAAASKATSLALLLTPDAEEPRVRPVRGPRGRQGHVVRNALPVDADGGKVCHLSHDLPLGIDCRHRSGQRVSSLVGIRHPGGDRTQTFPIQFFGLFSPVHDPAPLAPLLSLRSAGRDRQW